MKYMEISSVLGFQSESIERKLLRLKNRILQRFTTSSNFWHLQSNSKRKQIPLEDAFLFWKNQLCSL